MNKKEKKTGLRVQRSKKSRKKLKNYETILFPFTRISLPSTWRNGAKNEEIIQWNLDSIPERISSRINIFQLPCERWQGPNLIETLPSQKSQSHILVIQDYRKYHQTSFVSCVQNRKKKMFTIVREKIVAFRAAQCARVHSMGNENKASSIVVNSIKS